MFEKFGNQSPGKFIFVQDNKGTPVVGPSYQFGIFGFVQKAVRRSQLVIITGAKQTKWKRRYLEHTFLVFARTEESASS